MRPRRLFRILLVLAVAAGSAVTSAVVARSRAPYATRWNQASPAAAPPHLLGAVHPGILAAFQLLVSVTALVAFSPDKQEK